MKALYAFSTITILLLSVTYTAWAQSYQGALTLDALPSKVNVGDTIVFSGQLTASDGKYVVPSRTIYIKDDVTLASDTIIGTVTTDSNGKYAGSWTVTKRSGGGSYNFYAVFEGDQYVTKARSTTYKVQVESSDSTSSPSSVYQPISTKIILNKLPSSVYVGDTVTFKGALTANDKAIQNGKVVIWKDNAPQPEILASGVTDSTGTFSISWKAKRDLAKNDISIYAFFAGDSNYSLARSSNQLMSILRYAGTITLDAIPASANIGSSMTFTGTLKFNKGSPEGAIVYIKDEDPANPDDLLATAYVSKDGKFSANWFVTRADADLVADIYAVFEGNDQYYRLTTCDPKPTSDYGGSCLNTIKLKTNQGTKPSTTPANPPTGNEYMELYYSLDFPSNPNIAIVPSPDSYELASKYIVPTEEGILIWTSYLNSKYGGDWQVDFEVISDEKTFFSSKPDIVVNLVTPDKDSGCLQDYYGVAWPTTVKPVQSNVCVVYGNSERSSIDVSATAAHEFIHAMGLGHTWGLQGDLMCSGEMVSGSFTYTCPNYHSGKSKSPSELNLGGIVSLYGEDGYKNPNSKVVSKTKYYLDSDRDGIPDNKDKCKKDRETKNGYQDEDGCPDKP